MAAEYIVIGKIGATYGVRGWLKIHTYTQFDSNILSYSPWYLSDKDQENWQAVTIEDGRAHHNTIIVKFPHVDSKEAAQLLTGKLIAITREQLPELKKGEFYWRDLEGLNVINKDGKSLGKVIYLIETGANDVLVVKGEKEHAIPYLPGRVILNIDLEKQEILVDWEII